MTAGSSRPDNPSTDERGTGPRTWPDRRSTRTASQPGSPSSAGSLRAGPTVRRRRQGGGDIIGFDICEDIPEARAMATEADPRGDPHRGRGRRKAGWWPSRTRSGAAWHAGGCQMGAFEAALAYAEDRVQIGRPIAGFQLIQDLTARMAGNVTASLGIAVRVARSQEEAASTTTTPPWPRASSPVVAGRPSPGRELFGGNGILLDRDVIRYSTTPRPCPPTRHPGDHQSHRRPCAHRAQRPRVTATQRPPPGSPARGPRTDDPDGGTRRGGVRPSRPGRAPGRTTETTSGGAPG
ncbi:acyl-CoA dehydrogenase family protein [Geodermatophilus maliterrae]|uniref:Acyl-CoA dehydrogenase family protein n=1 Tax=Geodermatophilus maliterrae TaxID=3162531 RepID=A0ABV3XJK6_9ACTN